jgi:AsmA protein
MANGEVSKLFLEKLGLHLLEILQLQIIGDRAVKVRCMVADFAVQGGVMRTSTLLLDSEVTTVTGSGTVDLARERLDLTLVPKTRNTSMIALRSPIRIGGSFAAPQVAIDKAGILARTAGAVALAMVNPLLVIIPLVEMGPGEASRCAAVSRH